MHQAFGPDPGASLLQTPLALWVERCDPCSLWVAARTFGLAPDRAVRQATGDDSAT